MTIKTMYVGIVIQDNGTEGIPTFVKNNLTLPLIASDITSLETMKKAAQNVANLHGARVTLVKFTTREEIQIMEPDTCETGKESHSEFKLGAIPPECPACGTILDGATELTGTNEAPSDGDLSSCLGCLAALKFKEDGNGNMKLELLSKEEYEALPKDARDAMEKFKGMVMHLRMQSLAGMGGSKQNDS